MCSVSTQHKVVVDVQQIRDENKVRRQGPDGYIVGVLTLFYILIQIKPPCKCMPIFHGSFEREKAADAANNIGIDIGNPTQQ